MIKDKITPAIILTAFGSLAVIPVVIINRVFFAHSGAEIGTILFLFN